MDDLLKIFISVPVFIIFYFLLYSLIRGFLGWKFVNKLEKKEIESNQLIRLDRYQYTEIYNFATTRNEKEGKSLLFFKRFFGFPVFFIHFILFEIIFYLILKFIF